MLLRIYSDPGVVARIVEDAETAPIPDIHKRVFRFARCFTQRSWKTREAEIQSLRGAGVRDAEIALWASRAAGQTWFVMSADGGGVALDGGGTTGRAVARARERYHAASASLTASSEMATPLEPTQMPGNGICWIDVDPSKPRYAQVSLRARERYGFVPNLTLALSLRDETLHRNDLALELLDRPQSGALDARRHAMVRARVSSLNRCIYSRATTRALLERRSGEKDLWERVVSKEPVFENPADQRVVDFATKLARNAYKVTARDAESFREAGLSDEAYVEVLNTTALQTSLDRLANTLGVVPDEEPVLAA